MLREIIKDKLKDLYLFFRFILLCPFLIFRKTTMPEGVIKRILLLRHDRIGDMVLSTAVFKALKDKYPAAHITVVASRRNRDVIQSDPNVDETFVYDGLWSFIKYSRKKRIDLTVDLFYTYELKQAFLAYFSFARYRLGFENSGREIFFNIRGPKMIKGLPMLKHFFELLSCLGIEKNNYEPQLYLLQNEKEWARGYLQSQGIQPNDLLLALHIGGFYPAQRWPVERFTELGKGIIEKIPVKLLFFGESGEKEALESIRDKLGINNVSICCGVELRQVMSILGECRLLICNNTGVLHIASALKIPTVSTMGPTDPVLWGPCGQSDIVIRHDLPCSPCGLSDCKSHECMKTITVEEILRAVYRQLKVN